MVTKKEQEVVKDENIQVSKGLLDKITEELADLRKQNAMLLATGDKSRQAAYYDKNQKALPKIVKLSSFSVNGKEKIILDSKLTTNEVYKDNMNRWHEDQKILLHFDDDTLKTMDYKDYVSLCHKNILAKIVSRTFDEVNDRLMFKVERMDNGQIIDIEDKFVN